MSIKTTDWLGALACVVAGILIAALPHFIAWTKTGQPDYVLDADDRFYLAPALARISITPASLAILPRLGKAQSPIARCPSYPGIWAAKVLGLGPLGVGLMWRVLAGATVGLGWYLLFRLKVTRPSVAVSLSLILLCDTGLTQGTPLVRLLTRAMMTASLPANALIHETHWIHLEWRSITPATTMVYLIVMIWAVLRVRESPTCGANHPGGAGVRPTVLRLFLLLDRHRARALARPGT